MAQESTTDTNSEPALPIAANELPAIWIDDFSFLSASPEIVSRFFKATTDAEKRGAAIALSMKDMDAVIEKEKKSKPDLEWYGSYYYLPHGISAILANGKDRKDANRISRNENNIVVFATPSVAMIHPSSFKVVGIKSVRRDERIVNIEAICRLIEPPQEANGEPGMCFVLLQLDSRNTKEWPLGEYEFNLDFCLLDDIYVKEIAPELRPVKRSDHVQQRITLKFELIE